MSRPIALWADGESPPGEKGCVMETIYKFTDSACRTYGGFQWELGREYEFPGNGKLCSEAYAHGYRHPLLAVAFRPIHCPAYSRLWRGYGEVGAEDGTKVGLVRCKLIEEISAPEFSLLPRVRWAILMAYPRAGEAWRAWADRWLSGEDRSPEAALEAAALAEKAKAVAAWSAAGAALEAAAWSAAKAAKAAKAVAAWSAKAAKAAKAAEAEAAEAAAWSAAKKDSSFSPRGWADLCLETIQRAIREEAEAK